MSGIAGIFRRDGGGADARLLDRMIRALAHRGPDGSGRHVDGPIGLAHLALNVTLEAAAGRQPLADPSGSSWITFAGRLDNRDELRDALGAAADWAAGSDAALVLRAYARWAEDSVARLEGDFAFALWDDGRKQLVCARDALGVAPFFYAADAGAFRWASEPQAIFADPSVGRRPNEGVVGEYLAGEPSHPEETLFDGVLRLPPAHMLIVRAERARKVRYWEPRALDVGCRSDEEYGEGFREVLGRAVGARLRSDAPVGAQLSGGLDSSAIVGMATSLARGGGAAAPGLETLSLVFPGRAYDERQYIDAVAGWCRVASTCCVPSAADAPALLASLDRGGEFPDFPTGEALMRPVFEAARARGMKALLTGVGGDQWLGGTPFHYADLIRRRRWRSLARSLRTEAAGGGVAGAIRLVLKTGVLPLVPAPARQAARSVLRARAVPRWVHPAFARRVALEERIRKPALTPSRGAYARADVERLLTSGWEALLKETLERGAAWHGLEYRHPFYDRRLVEFALALPEEQRQRDGLTKVVLRTAMRELLPPLVLARESKVDVSEIYLHALEALGGERCLDRLSVASAGWIDPRPVKRLYRDSLARARRGDAGFGAHMIPLWMILGVEHWHRALQGIPTAEL